MQGVFDVNSSLPEGTIIAVSFRLFLLAQF